MQAKQIAFGILNTPLAHAEHANGRLKQINKQKNCWNHDGYVRTSGSLSASLRLPRQRFDFARQLKARQPPRRTGRTGSSIYLSIVDIFYTAKQRHVPRWDAHDLMPSHRSRVVN